jgi:hypothetical protein
MNTCWRSGAGSGKPQFERVVGCHWGRCNPWCIWGRRLPGVGRWWHWICDIWLPFPQGQVTVRHVRREDKLSLDLSARAFPLLYGSWPPWQPTPASNAAADDRSRSSGGGVRERDALGRCPALPCIPRSACHQSDSTLSARESTHVPSGVMMNPCPGSRTFPIVKIHHESRHQNPAASCAADGPMRRDHRTGTRQHRQGEPQAAICPRCPGERFPCSKV